MSTSEPPRPRSGLFYYVPVLIIALAVVVYVFIRNYHAGERAGLLAPPPATGKQSATPVVSERALAKDTKLAAKGKGLFDINCASCHGANGTGNGPRATGLNPPPRNYKTEKFKFGNDIVSLHNTLMKGSPGTSMPSFALLPLEDTWAIAHYVYTLIPNPPPITDELVAQLPESSGGQSAASSPQAGAPSDTSKQSAAALRIPVKLAVERMAHEPPSAVSTPNVSASHPGAAIYAQHCAECHGAHGEGKALRVISTAPDRFLRTASQFGSNSPWLRDRNQFAALVVKGLPGRTMPGNATLSRQQLDDLYAFVRNLSATP